MSKTLFQCATSINANEIDFTYICVLRRPGYLIWTTFQMLYGNLWRRAVMLGSDDPETALFV